MSRRWTAVIIGFIGSLVVIRPGFVELNLASFAALGTGLMYGFYLLITRKLSTSDNPLLTLLLTGLTGAVIISFAMPFVWIQPTAQSMVFNGLYRHFRYNRPPVLNTFIEICRCL